MGDCTVIGQYNDHHGDVLGYMLSESDGSWGHATELVLPAVSAPRRELSLAAILTPRSGPQTRADSPFTRLRVRVSGGRSRHRDDVLVLAQGGKRVLIATGQVRVGAPGRQAGAASDPRRKSLLNGIARLHISVVARFTPRVRQAAQHAVASFTLS